jgi:hypothetical protein
MKFNDADLVPPAYLLASGEEQSMSITVKWDNEAKTIIRQTYERNWQWEEFYAIADQTRALVKTVSHQVDIIADFLESGPLPLGPAITNARRVLSNLPSNWNSLIVVTNNGFIRVMVMMFNSYFANTLGSKVYIVSNFSDAYNLIASLQTGQNFG